MATIGSSKVQSIYSLYFKTGSYSTRSGNNKVGGVSVEGGFTTTGEYSTKYVGGSGSFGAGAPIGHTNYEFFNNRGVEEKPKPVVFNG